MKDLLSALYNTTPETHAGVTASVGGAAYFLTFEFWIGALTVLVLLSQFGLMIPKYWKVYQEWKAKREPKA